MNIKVKELYQCGACREIHDDEDDAKECCKPTVTTLFVCPVCEKHHDDADPALTCCGVSVIRCPSCYREHSSISLHYSAITVAGHCNACNPLFTVEQQLAIQDMHYQHTGIRVHLHE